MDAHARVFVAGGSLARGQATMTGAAIVRRLQAKGPVTLVGTGDEAPDLLNRAEVDRFFGDVRPDCVFVAAGQTAGIAGNERRPADLMIDNLLIASHVIPAAARAGVSKLLYLSSSCTYPKAAAHPLDPMSLWTGPLEPTSAPYAVAKLAGTTLCDAFRRQLGVSFFAAISADAYGPGDDFDPERSHVVAALIRRFHEARLSGAPSVSVWGSGAPEREFIYVDDLADAAIFALHEYAGPDPINLGTGASTSIGKLAAMVRDAIGYRGELVFDRSKPDGMPFKGLNSDRLRQLGWQPTVDLPTGLRRTYDWFLRG